MKSISLNLIIFLLLLLVITNCSNYHSSNSELLQLISKDVDFSQRLSSLKKKYSLVKETLRGYPEIQAVLKK